MLFLNVLLGVFSLVLYGQNHGDTLAPPGDASFLDLPVVFPLFGRVEKWHRKNTNILIFFNPTFPKLIIVVAVTRDCSSFNC